MVPVHKPDASSVAVSVEPFVDADPSLTEVAQNENDDHEDDNDEDVWDCSLCDVVELGRSMIQCNKVCLSDLCCIYFYYVMARFRFTINSAIYMCVFSV